MNSNHKKITTSLQDIIIQTRVLSQDAKKVTIDEGDYYINEPIRLCSEDSGLILEGKGKVRLFGGRRILNWEQKSDKFWHASLKEIGNKAWDFRMLIVNGRFAERARYPESGFLIHKSKFDVTWLSTYQGGFERKPTYEELTTLNYKAEDIPETFVPQNAEITCFHMWDESLVGVKSIDREHQTIQFSNPSGWPPGAFADAYHFEKRYIIWNTIEGMLKPGQWYLNKAENEIVYWPLPGEVIEGIEVIAPEVENIFILDGTPEKPIENITLKNLSISATNAPLMSGAFGAKLFDGALSVRNARNCTFYNIEIGMVGAHAIKADGNDLTIQNCHLHHCGAGAIRCLGSKASIFNNHIHDVGKTFPSAIALYVGATDPNVPEEWDPGQSYTDCIIEHNEIHDVPYAAICAGGKNLKIIKNFIYRAMQDLYDGAGIYITFCQNALVKNNFIKDIKDAPGAGTSAYYLDEKTVDALITENVEINVPRPSHNHISSRNTFRNNFFIIEGKGWFSMERSSNYTFEQNVVVATKGFAIYDLSFCPDFNNNILYTNGAGLITKDLDHYTVLKEYNLELNNGNINQDPLLLNYADGNIILDDKSPALQLGITPVNVSDAGLIRK